MFSPMRIIYGGLACAQTDTAHAHTDARPEHTDARHVLEALCFAVICRGARHAVADEHDQQSVARAVGGAPQRPMSCGYVAIQGEPLPLLLRLTL
eukprot:6175897-Pleurochrysis_carterae.AAC.1